MHSTRPSAPELLLALSIFYPRMRRTLKLFKRGPHFSEASSSSQSSVNSPNSAQDSSDGPNSSRRILSTTLNAAESSIRLVKEFSDSVPFLGAAASSVLFVIEECERYSRNSKAFEELVNPLQRMNSLLAPYKNSESTLPTRVMEQVEEFDKTISGIRQEVEDLKSSGRISRFINSRENEERIAAMVQRVKTAVEEIMLANLLDTSSGVKEVSRGVQEIALAQSLLALNPVHSARYNCVDRNQCLDGTRVSVLEDIQTWFSSGEEQVYWLNGAAGMGKTTIALSVAHRLVSEKDMLIGTFFCSRESIDRKTSGFIFPTLACQLASWNREYQNELVEVLKHYPYIGSALPHEQVQRLIVDPLQKVKPPTPVALVIDALDECDGERSPEQILLALLQHVHTAPSLKVFVSCRPAAYVEVLLSSGEHRRMFKLHHVPPSIVDSDLRLFYNRRLEEIRSAKSLVAQDWPPAELVEKLVRHAAGLFIFAVTVCKYVASPGDARRRLDYLANLSMADYKDSLSVDMLYTEVLSAAIEKISDVHDRRDFARVLASVMLVQEPLTVNTLGYLLGLDGPIICDLLRDIHPILSAPHDAATGNSEVIRSFHASFPEYMTAPDRAGTKVPLAFIPPPEQHLELALCCLQCMNRDLKRMLPHSQRFFSNAEIEDLDVRIEKNISAALRYACLYWADHLVSVPTARLEDSPVFDELREFTTTKLLFWFECLSVLGAADAIVTILVKGDISVRSTGNRHEPTLHLLRDAYHAVQGFFPIVKDFAVHLYLSFILFLPRKSLLLQHYSHHLHPSYKITGHLRQGWNPLLRQRSIDPCNSISFSPDGRNIAYVSDFIQSFNILHPNEYHQAHSPVHIPSMAPDVPPAWNPEHTPGVDVRFPGLFGEHLQPSMTSLIWLSSKEIVTACTILSAAAEPFKSFCYVSVWDPETLEHKRLLLQTSESANFFLPVLAVSPKERYIGVSTPSSIFFWDTETWEQIHIFAGPTEHYRCFSMSDSHYLIGQEFREIQETARLEHTLAIDPKQVGSCRFSPDAKMVAFGFVYGVVEIWNVFTRAVIFSHKSPAPIGAPPPSVAFSPDGGLVAFSCGDHVYLLSIAEQCLVSRFSLESSCSVAFSPGGENIACLNEDGAIHVWSLAVGGDVVDEDLAHLSAPSSDRSDRIPTFGPHYMAACIADGQCIVGDSEGRLYLWDCGSGSLIRSWEAHPGAVTAVAASRDCRFLASSDASGTMIWSLSRLNQNDRIRPDVTIPAPNTDDYRRDLNGLSFSRESTKLVTLNGHILEFWQFSEGASWQKLTQVRMSMNNASRDVVNSPDEYTFNETAALSAIGFNHDWLTHCYHGLPVQPLMDYDQSEYCQTLTTQCRSPFKWWTYSKTTFRSFTHFQLCFSQDEESVLAPAGIYDIATAEQFEDHSNLSEASLMVTAYTSTLLELFWKDQKEYFKRNGTAETLHPLEGEPGWVADPQGRRCFWIPQTHYGHGLSTQWYRYSSRGDRFVFISDDTGQSEGLVFVQIEGTND